MVNVIQIQRHISLFTTKRDIFEDMLPFLQYLSYNSLKVVQKFNNFKNKTPYVFPPRVFCFGEGGGVGVDGSGHPMRL